MSEIKFRAWSKIEEKFVDDFVIDKLGNEYQYNKCEFWGDDRQVVLMQYTGLKDENGKEIYEGDIVELGIPKRNPKKFIRKEVHFANGCFNPRTLSKGHWKIIGNIYENPNLIKDEKL